MISMDAKPSQMLRRGKGTSMWNAIEAVKNPARRSPPSLPATPAR
jgi:fatty acid/phospholipid biosynthesis enzyme